MDKPLPDKDKKLSPEGQTPAQAVAPVVSPAFAANPKIDLSKDAIGAYSQDISQNSWDKAVEETQKKPLWTDDPKKRLAIRAFSRGVLGSIFFTAGGMLATKSMKHYDASKGFAETKDPLQFIAKTIDTFVGKPIEFTVGSIYGAQAGKNAIRFRRTNHSRDDDWGRSLGDEVVKITFDFFLMSVGDAIGRDIAAFMDPNVKQSWIDDKGRVKPTDAVKALLRNTWRYVSYNGGEDWAVAIPYVYFMKANRRIINSFSPGFRNDADRAGNGSGFKLKIDHLPDGTIKPDIIGNYNVEGAIDFQARFTTYNVFTLMFREAYNYAINKWKGEPDSLYGAPDKQVEKRSLLGNAGHLAKWFARSIVKGVIIMTPTVPFFWITRVPQSTYKATFIDPEHGHVSRLRNPKDDPLTGTRTSLHVNHLIEDWVSTPHDLLALSRYDQEKHDREATGNPYTRQFFPGRNFDPVVEGHNFDPFKKSFGPVDKVFNAIGRTSDRAAKSLDTLAERADVRWGKVGMGIKRGLGIDSFRKFSREYVNAAASYTPYMYAKAEFSHLWDNGKTDLAAERMIDGATSLNWSEFKAGLGEFAAAVLHEPFSDPAREAEAQRRISIDTSASETFDRDQDVIEERREAANRAKSAPKPTNWRDHLITAPQASKKQPGGDGAALSDNYKAVGALIPSITDNHAQREEMRKALEALQPPTNAIN